MIFAIEGPDCAGKTTLFRRLEKLLTGPVFVPNVPLEPVLLPVIDALQRRTVALWTALHVPELLYIADRVPFVSNIVYARVHRRAVPYYPEWVQHLRVLYLRPPLSELRLRGCPDPELQMLHYDGVLCEYQHRTTDDADPIDFALLCIQEVLREGSLRDTRRVVEQAPRW